MTTTTPQNKMVSSSSEVLDLYGVGLGPFNLSLAALSSELPQLHTFFADENRSFAWHPGLLLEDATLQVPFLADLVTMVRPTSRWSFLNYLARHDRMFPFYFSENFHITRAEYNNYLNWVSCELENTHFGHHVTHVGWDAQLQAFAVTSETASGTVTHLAKNLALGIGTEPVIPQAFETLPPEVLIHSSSYKENRDILIGTPRVTIIGSGQSGAEVFLDLLRSRPLGEEGLAWIARSPHFAPMEYSKLGLEQFTPDYTAYFRDLIPSIRDSVLPLQWQLYKGASAQTLSDIHSELYRRSISGSWPAAILTPATEVTNAGLTDGGCVRLTLRNAQQGRTRFLTTDRVVVATGYRGRSVTNLLRGLGSLLDLDDAGRILVDGDQRIHLAPQVSGSIYVQNAEMHTHGVGVPDLGLAAWRAATIINHLVSSSHSPPFQLPRRTAFTTFGLPEAQEQCRTDSALRTEIHDRTAR